MFYAFGSTSPYMKGSVKMLAFNRTPEGYTHASPYAERSVRPPTGDYGHSGWCAYPLYKFNLSLFK